MRRIEIWALVAASLFVMAGCSAIPSAGPTSAQITEDAGKPGPSDYIVADIDDRVVSILARTSGTSFSGTFGYRRPPPNQKIGIGDVVDVTIWEAAAGGLFSQSGSDRGSGGAGSANIPEQVVGQDGSITVPYAGRIRIAGMTTNQVEQLITQRLTGKAIEPAVLVTIPKNLSNTVTIVGEVTNGARVPLSVQGDHVLDVIASAGGIRSPAHESFVKLQRKGQSISMPMQRLIADASENIYVYPGDVVTVVREPQTYTIFGASMRNAVVPFDAAGITLEQAVAKPGGLIDNRSDPSGVFLLRWETPSVARQIDPTHAIDPTGKEVAVVYRLNLREAKSYFLARRIQVRNGDILYIANAPLTELQKVLMLFTLAAQPVQTYNTLHSIN